MSLLLQNATCPIDGYELHERIGAGGYGEVWRASAPGGLSKAVKFVYGHLDEEGAAREMKALQRIREVRHPFLLSLERIEVIDGQLAIVTELADASLKDRYLECQQAGLPGIPRDELVGHLRDAAEALDFMSERHGLQHLDVKPENLLLVGGRVKVADFGLVKDLVDGSVSLMGSLTPVYAPPEVFDGQPSRHSDQYSLAIVFQELLTGILPFPGKTLAQLAAQHTGSRPRLTPLAAADQAIIGQALAKDPAHRHAGCRALIEALLTADRSRPGAAVERPGDLGASFATADTKTRGQQPTEHSPQHPSRTASPPGDVPSVQRTVMLDGDVSSDSGAAVAVGSRASWRQVHSIVETPAADDEPSATVDLSPSAVVTLPPLDGTAADATLRPTLFIGLGGLAGHALARLRRRLSDRLGDLANVPALQLLLIDADGKALARATSGGTLGALPVAQTLALPLRRTLDYRTNSKRLLQWLSRRWLYNIPRSLQTEGLRPLGRLALVDHIESVLARLREALSAITSPASLAQSAAATGRPCQGPPRVFVVSSMSGGAGSGMALDIGYAVRHVLAELGLPVEGLCGLLAHATGRDADGQALATANSLALLHELDQYTRPNGGYPGDAACGLPSFAPGVAPFANTYLLHLGDDLADNGFEQATDALAEYLYQGSTGAAAGLLDACRRSESEEAEHANSSPNIRSFGLVRWGASSGDSVAPVVEAVCRKTIDLWRGAIEAGIDAQAARLADERGLSYETLAGHIRRAVAKGVGGDSDVYVRRIVAGYQVAALADKANDNAPASPLAIANRALGLADCDEPPPKSLGMVEAALPGMLAELAVQQFAPAKSWVLALVGASPAGAQAAGRAADWFTQHFKALEKRAVEERAAAREELQALERDLAAIDRGRRGWSFLGLGAAGRGAAEREAWLTRYCHARLRGAVLQGVSHYARALAAQAAALGAQLKDLARDIAQAAGAFDAASARGDDPSTAALVGKLRKPISQLASEVDAVVRPELFGVDAGLPDVLSRQVDLKSALPARLRTTARGAVLAALRQIDAIDAVLPAGDADGAAESLEGACQQATPLWLATGGAKRLLLLLPAGSSPSRLQDVLASKRNEQASLAPADEGELLLGYEVSGLSIPRIAAALAEDHPECRDAAARLHARIDVHWPRVAPWR